MKARQIIVNGCDPDLCPYSWEKGIPDWGTQMHCNHPQMETTTLGFNYDGEYGVGWFPSVCPLQKVKGK